MTKIFLIISLVLGLYQLHAQTWDYVKYASIPLQAHNASYGAISHPGTNEIFSLEKGTYSTNFSLVEYRNGSYFNFNTYFPSNITFPRDTYNHLTANSSFVFLAGKQSNDGVVYMINQNSSSSPAPPPIITVTNASGAPVELKGITLEGPFIYFVGNTQATAGNPITFTANAGSSIISPTASEKISFVAKYNIATWSLEWSTHIISGGSVEDIVVEYLGDIYITGLFKHSIDLKTGSGTSTYNSTNNSDNFLIKLDALGVYNPTWGFKHETRDVSSPLGYNDVASFDVKVDQTDNAVYYTSYHQIIKHSTLGSGNLIWKKHIKLPTSDYPLIHQFELTHCDQLAIVGQDLFTANRGTCQWNAFVSVCNKFTSSTVYHSTSTSCDSKGTAVLIENGSKISVIGSFNPTVPLAIDNNPPSSANGGIFLGRLNKHSSARASFVNPCQIVSKNSLYGLIDVAVLSLCSEWMVDGSASACETDYFVELTEFDLISGTNSTPLYSGWVSSTQAPNNIQIIDFIPAGYQVRPNIIYKFRLAVGPQWEATDIWFKVDCCDCDTMEFSNN